MKDPNKILWDGDTICSHAGTIGWGFGSSKSLSVVHIGFRRGFGHILGHDQGVEIEVPGDVILHTNQKTLLRPVANPNTELRWGLLL